MALQCVLASVVFALAVRAQNELFNNASNNVACGQVTHSCHVKSNPLGSEIRVQCKNNVKLKLDELIWCHRLKTKDDDDGSTPIDPASVKKLHISGSLMPELDLSALRHFVHLRTLNVSGNGIRNISWSDCDLTSLVELDFSFNRLEHVFQGVFTCNPRLMAIGMKGNIWDCKLLEWFLDWARVAQKNGTVFLDKQEVQCLTYETLSRLMNETETHGMWDMINSCPRNCSCVLKFGKTMIVDCSGRNFLDFPDIVPNNTRNLLIQNNTIRNFQKLIHTDAYRKLTQLSVEDNAIRSLAELEGIYRTINITTLNVAGNQITHLPVHILEQMKLTSLKLGRNPWDCDCTPGTALRDFLTDHFRHIQDMDNITCSFDKSHPGKLVRRLTQVDLCYVPPSEIHTLDIVNAFLALLIILVLTKLIYDWLHFRKTGRLPLSPKAYFFQQRQAWKERNYSNYFDAERHSYSDGIKA